MLFSRKSVQAFYQTHQTQHSASLDPPHQRISVTMSANGYPSLCISHQISITMYRSTDTHHLVSAIRYPSPCQPSYIHHHISANGYPSACISQRISITVSANRYPSACISQRIPITVSANGYSYPCISQLISIT